MESIGKGDALDCEIAGKTRGTGWRGALSGALGCVYGYALGCALSFLFPAGNAAAGTISEDFGRYAVIVEKFPFGAPPPSGSSDGPDGETAASEGAAGAGGGAGDSEGLPSPVKLASVSRFGGVPAAGLVDTETGVSFLLRPGDSHGAYRLIDLDPELGAAVVARGTNEWLVSLAWAAGQPTNIVPSAREPFLTAFRPFDGENAAVPVEPTPQLGESARTKDSASGAPPPGAPLAAAQKGGVSTGISPEEEAEIVAKATVVDPDGSTHVSFRELNRLRAKLRREKAEKARAEEIAAAEARRAEAAAEAAAKEKAAAANEEREDAEETRRRRALIEAIALGYDVGEDIELTAEEAERLREAGYQVPQ